MLQASSLPRCLAAFFLTGVSSAEVHLVELRGTAGLISIQAAVDLAREGDTIVVRDRAPHTGTAPGFTIDGKGLTVIGVGTFSFANPARVGSAEVRNLPAGSTVVIRGFDFDLEGAEVPTALKVTDAVGAVRVENCSIEGRGSDFSATQPTVDLDHALDVVFVDCAVEGTFGNAAIDASSSRIALYRTTVIGAAGAPSSSYDQSIAGDAFAGVSLHDRSFAWMGLSHVEGGPGGFADCIHLSACTAVAGDGGNGIEVEPGSTAIALESEFVEGEAGEAFSGAIGGGTDGVPGADIVGVVQMVPGNHRDMEAPISVGSGESAHFVLHGEPGELVTLFVGEAGGHRFFGADRGILLVNGGFVSAPMDVGVVPASGVLEVDIPLFNVAVDAASALQVQALFRASQTSFRFAPPRAVMVMGDATPFVERPEIVYVNQGAAVGGYGRSWQHAAKTLYDSVGSLPYGAQATEVWLAGGAYTPAPPSDPLSNSRLETIGNFDLLGGFAGTETSADQRNASTHLTIVNGDLLGDDRLPDGSRAENSNGLLYVRSFVGERRFRFSGIAFLNSRSGAAIDFHGDHLVVDDCAFLDCQGGNHSGGIACHFFSQSDTVEIRSSRLHRNHGSSAGAISLTGSSVSGHVLIEGCEFLGNSASTEQVYAPGVILQFGGAFHADDMAITLEIKNSTFLDNDEEETNPNAVCAFGGIYVEPESDVTLVNSIIYSHRVVTGLESDFSTVGLGAGDVMLHNCAHALPPSWSTAQNFAGSPSFLAAIGPDGIWASGDENLRLGAGSQCIDAGASELVSTELDLDLDRQPRFVDDPSAPNVGTGGTRIVDMGAYERQAP